MLDKYKDLPFVDRVLNPADYPKPTFFDEQGRPQTHLLSADFDERTGNWFAWPKITVKDGQYVKQSFQEAINSGDVINFGKNKEGAIEFSKTYKPKEFEEYYRQNKKVGGVADIDKALEEILGGQGSLGEDPLYKFSMMFIGPSGKFKAADIVTDFFKHQRIQSLLKSNAPGDLIEVEQIRKGLKIKNPAEAEKLYLDVQNKGKQLASPEDIQRAIEEFLKK
jgi:hypothetical protein